MFIIVKNFIDKVCWKKVFHCQGKSISMLKKFSFSRGIYPKETPFFKVLISNLFNIREQLNDFPHIIHFLFGEFFFQIPPIVARMSL